MKTPYLHFPYGLYALLSCLLFLLPIYLPAQLLNPPAILYEESSHTFKLVNEPAIHPFGVSLDQPYWDYHWEFGDGHYSDEIAPNHQYEKADSYQVRLYLSPRYSATTHAPIEQQIVTRGGRRKAVDYDLHKRRVYIQPNTPTSLVPGDEFQLALMYGNSGFSDPIGAGYLFLFYNKKKEVPVNYKRLNLVSKARAFQDLQLLTPATQIAKDALSDGVQKAVINDLNEYEDNLVFKINNLGRDEQRNVFLSFQTALSLKKLQDKNRTISISAIFVPTSGEFKLNKHRVQQDFSILSVYDPNKIRVEERRLYFHPKATRNLNYIVDFQNKERGTVNQVSLRIPLSTNLSSEDAVVSIEDPSIGATSICPIGIDPTTVDSCCYEVKRIIRDDHRDSLVVNIYNIGLRGKKSLGLFQSKGSSKGKINVQLKSRAARSPLSEAYAKIYFDQVPPIRTNIARTKWRRKSWFIIPSFGIELSDKIFSFDPNQLIDRFGLGLALIDSPLSRGIVKGVELNYNPLSFSRQNFTDDGLLIKESTHLHNIDLNILVGYQLTGALRISTGLGISFPLFAKTQLTQQATIDEGESYFTTALSELEYGLLAPKPELIVFDTVLDNPPDNPPGDTPNNVVLSNNKAPQSLGGFWRTSLEFGMLDRVAIGISQEFRYYPKLYFNACGHFSTYSVFARIRLADGKRR